MRDLNHDFKRLCQRNRDGAFATQHDREGILTLVANQLHEGGFRHLRAQGARSKHVEHLVQRWLTENIGKPYIVARVNAAYGIAERQHVSNVS